MDGFANNFITSWAEDIIRTVYNIHGPWGGRINFWCFIRHSM